MVASIPNDALEAEGDVTRAWDACATRGGWVAPDTDAPDIPVACDRVWKNSSFAADSVHVDATGEVGAEIGTNDGGRGAIVIHGEHDVL